MVPQREKLYIGGASIQENPLLKLCCRLEGFRTRVLLLTSLRRSFYSSDFLKKPHVWVASSGPPVPLPPLLDRLE